MSDQVVCQTLIVKNQTKIQTSISFLAAVKMKTEAVTAIGNLANDKHSCQWLDGLKAALEVVIALPLPENAP